ncbi:MULTISPECIES: AAA family ATPase [Clostridium]|uniref:AAA family ATPase n=1 Tax=Clostridium TaxID=1485 RepID=UPI00069F971F|nr:MULTISPECIES: AAA family ATPase [Clostridium]KOF56071.1 ATPase [Clostridium sp. DMHC 10]MCD2345717.1 ATP-binding protein [Clostridium guangxiense]
MKKKLILVGSPPACGKSYVSMELCKNLSNPVYLDKDTIIPLSKKVFEAANEPINRSSAFFEKYVRDAEYVAIMDVAFESLRFNDHVIVNAPFSKEYRNKEYIGSLKEKLKDYDAELIPVWVSCDIEVCHERMIKRNSERDTWKLEHWDEYIKGRDYSVPDLDGVYVIDNSSTESFKKDLDGLLKVL